MNPGSDAADRVVDARGCLCPIPTVRAALALEDMSRGQTLDLLADDPVTRRDLPAWCRGLGHAVASVRDEGAVFRMRIQKGA
ncbi:MAG: sulfurtransferase TusA family protein [Elusimicrobiota bacterium]